MVRQALRVCLSVCGAVKALTEGVLATVAGAWLLSIMIQHVFLGLYRPARRIGSSLGVDFSST